MIQHLIVTTYYFYLDIFIFEDENLTEIATSNLPKYVYIQDHAKPVQ